MPSPSRRCALARAATASWTTISRPRLMHLPMQRRWNQPGLGGLQPGLRQLAVFFGARAAGGVTGQVPAHPGVNRCIGRVRLPSGIDAVGRQLQRHRTGHRLARRKGQAQSADLNWPAMNWMMTTAPTSQTTRFTLDALCRRGLGPSKAGRRTAAWARVRQLRPCLAAQVRRKHSPDNPAALRRRAPSRGCQRGQAGHRQRRAAP